MQAYYEPMQKMTVLNKNPLFLRKLIVVGIVGRCWNISDDEKTVINK